MNIKIQRLFLLFILTTFIINGCTSCIRNKTQNNIYSVKRIIDGDTFVVDDGTKKGEKIRLIGIDAPETRKSKNKDIGYLGKESTAYLKELLSDGKVRLEYDVQQYDKYGRTLAYVHLEDGTFVNAEMVKHGFATLMTIPPNVKYSELFVELQKEARDNKRGMWRGD